MPPPLKSATATTEVALAQALKLADRHNPASPVHPVSPATESTGEAVSGRSSHYISSPIRETMIMDYKAIKTSNSSDDIKSPGSSKAKKSLLGRLRLSRTRPANAQPELTHGKTDRLQRFTSFRGCADATPAVSLATRTRKAAEEKMLRDSALLHTYWM
ncbi:hypothetical protein LTR53_011097 [Teratosphaeriaceae sp. CCFEE 6253]|nr:hypothetical protein LTR53_011097 [Teratosphaeriaceae sp. CCFEE 6253]